MSFFEAVKRKINNEINPENIVIIDNSNLHKTHNVALKVVIAGKSLPLTVEIHSQ